MKYFFIIIASVFCQSAKANDYSCTTLPELLYHLYNTDDNLLHLNKFFYPPQHEAPTFLHVKYTFKSADDMEDTKYSVNYIWAEGGFLLIATL